MGEFIFSFLTLSSRNPTMNGIHDLFLAKHEKFKTDLLQKLQCFPFIFLNLKRENKKGESKTNPIPLKLKKVIKGNSTKKLSLRFTVLRKKDAVEEISQTQYGGGGGGCLAVGAHITSDGRWQL